MSNLLARFAENAYWMARYMERAENLARILDVNETFARDSRGAADWLPIVQLHSDDERFFDLHPVASADAVVQFYVLDRDNPNSIVSAISAARENARSLRHLISTEMWSQLNVFHGYLTGLKAPDAAPNELSWLCTAIKEGCQTHAGIVEGTLYRDEAWNFYQLGKAVERADQTTRILDIKYHRLLPSADDVDSQVDAGQWNALLRSVSGYHAFRRVHSRGMGAEQVAEFLIFDADFPRSIQVCARQMEMTLDDLGANYLPGALRGLRAALDTRSIDDIANEGLHQFLDWVQIRLNDCGADIGRTFFGHGQ